MFTSRLTLLRNNVFVKTGMNVAQNNRPLLQQTGPANCQQKIKQPTAGILIIGDEILKAQTRDTNSHYLCKRLFDFGIRVEKVSVLKDDVDVIANEVSSFSSLYTYVITSGGIGPTHDDVTFEGVARAFGDELILHPELADICKKIFKTDDPGSPAMRLATIPSTARLNYGFDRQKGLPSRYPVVSVRNVFVFPGVPSLLERNFDMLAQDMFNGSGHRFEVSEMYLSCDEVKFAPVLNQAVDKFKDDVVFGSYPEYFHSYYKVRLTLQADKAETLHDAEAFLKAALPQECLVDFDQAPTNDAATKISRLVESTSPLAKQVSRARKEVDACLAQYSLDEICVSFNGGKDCTALLHLVHAAAADKGLLAPDTKLTAFYVKEAKPFPQVEEFMKEAAIRYNLNVMTYSGCIREALAKFKADFPKVKVILMGQRSTDPRGVGLRHWTPTDADWPAMMRVCPILEWSYSDVWAFIRSLYVPYCKLYDRGYTSLGSMDVTLPNPELEETDRLGRVVYRPAHTLANQNTERIGRR